LQYLLNIEITKAIKMPKPYYQNCKEKIQEILRVDHAGEFGAKRIYEGQIAYTKNANDKKLIKHMLDQEAEHLEYFDNQIKAGKSRPTILMPIWNIFGYTLGAISAKCGNEAAMLVTESVEEVIVDHYQEQIDYLEKSDVKNPLLNKIKKFKQDEADHIHIALENNSSNARFRITTSAIVKTFCKAAIFLSKKI
jgi:3-demethoxyubiquinol 3-hydroxylase